MALDLSARWRWWYLHGEGRVVLGEHAYRQALVYGEPVAVSDSPLKWLQRGAEGCCHVSDCEAEWRQAIARRDLTRETRRYRELAS